DPALEPERLVPPLTPELQARVPARLLRTYVGGETLAEALPLLRQTYCGRIAYELQHISDHEERIWLRPAIESGRYRTPLSAGGRGRPARVRGRADGRGRRRGPRGRDRRREVPPRRGGRPYDRDRRGHRHPGREPEPAGGGRPGRRGTDARRADRPRHARRAPRLVRRHADPDPRRRRVPRSGNRRRDAQPREPRGVLD